MRLKRSVVGDRAAVGVGVTAIVSVLIRFAVAFEGPTVHASEVDGMFKEDVFTSDTARSMQGLALLVVEDEPSAKILLLDALEFVGALVTLRGTCQAALTQLKRSHHFDVMLFNIVLPDGSGYTLLETWRQWEQAHGLTMTPAVAVTAAVTAVNRAKATAAGFQSFVAKPYELEQLFSAVAAATGTRKDDQYTAAVKL